MMDFISTMQLVIKYKATQKKSYFLTKPASTYCYNISSLSYLRAKYIENSIAIVTAIGTKNPNFVD